MKFNQNFKIICCTSLNKKIFKEYAEINVQRFKKFLPQNFKISIFSEEKLNIPNHTKVKNLFENYDKVKQFISFHKNNPRKYNLNFLVKTYQVNYLKFCFKIFTMINASRLYSNYDFMLWLDTDIYI